MKKFFILVILLSSALIINCFAQQLGWDIVPSGTTEELNSIFFYDYEVGFACGNSGTVIKSIDSGKTSQTLQTPVTNDLNDLFVFNDSTLCVVGDSGTIIFSLEGGYNWYIGSNFLTEDYYSVSFSGANGIYGGSSQTIVRAKFEGTSIIFYEVQTGFFGGGFLAAYMLSPQIGFVAGENSIFQPLFGVSADSGHNWDFTAFYLNNNEGRATGVDFTDLNIGYVSARVWDGQGAISKTTDNGNNWATTFFNNPLWGIDFPVSGASQVGYCVGDSGTILKTYNAGDIWQQQLSGRSEKLNKVYFLDLDFGLAVGENGTILRTTTGGELITQVKEKLSLVYEFNLEQNYPNPFNPSTSIQYALSSRQFVSLEVYDVLGNEIATLVNEEKPAGSYEVEFNSTSLPSGIYFYRLQAGSFIESKKMILIK